MDKALRPKTINSRNLLIGLVCNSILGKGNATSILGATLWGLDTFYQKKILYGSSGNFGTFEPSGFPIPPISGFPSTPQGITTTCFILFLLKNVMFKIKRIWFVLFNCKCVNENVSISDYVEKCSIVNDAAKCTK